MIWLTDPQTRCTYLSDGWYAFTGQTPESGLGFGWLEATHPDDRERAEAIFVTASARREAFRIDYRLRRRDGEFRWAIDSAAPRFAPGGEFLGYVGSVIDVTERRRAEEALRESEARFRTLFSSIDQGYCLCEIVLDDDGRPVDYRFLEANPLFETMTGLHGAVGRTALELVPDLEPSWVETYGAVALGDGPRRFEQGSEAMGRFFDVFATPVEPHGRFALVFDDVTERKRTEQALRDSEAAERAARVHAELLAELGAELEALDGLASRVRGLVELLVPRLADVARVEVPADPQPLVAVAPTDGAAAVRSDTASQIVVPLDMGLTSAGSLLVALTDPERQPYDDDDRAFVRKLAERVGVVFLRARLREEEHEVAVRLQQALLPEAIVRRAGVEIAARYEAGSDLLEVGGDWFDTFALADGQLGLAVGDVVGHGLDAAAAMGRLRVALAALAPHADGPGRLLSHLDAFAVGPDGAEFATACCAVLEPSTGVLRYASAGHPPMLVVSPAGDATWLEGGRSTPLYGRPHPDRPESSFVLEAGALLVLYSDGLVERRREPLGVGLGRLEQAVRKWRDEPVRDLCDRLVAELGVEAARFDDVVILCLRLTAPTRLRRVLPARPEALRRLRVDVRAWADARGLAEPARAALLLALGEACTNAIEHAYAGGEVGDVEVELADGEAGVRVMVRDRGGWREPRPSDGRRGRGTGIMQAVAADFERRTGPDGTTVTFRLPSRGPAA